MIATLVAAGVVVAAAILTALGIRAEIRKTCPPADDTDWLDPHATWLPNLSDADIDGQVDAAVAQAHAAYYREVSR